MSNIFLYTDLHIKDDRFDYPGRIKLILNELADLYFKAYEKKAKAVICLGDVVETSKKVEPYVFNKIHNFFATIQRRFNLRTIIIPGQHDVKSRGETEEQYSIIAPLMEFCEVIYGDRKIIEVGGNKFGVLGYDDKYSEDSVKEILNYYKKSKVKNILGHFTFKGAYPGEEGFDSKLFKDFDLVLCGHVHKRMTIGNVNYIGAFCQNGFIDEGNKTGYAIYDMKKDSLTYRNTNFEKFVTYNISCIDDYRKIEEISYIGDCRPIIRTRLKFSDNSIMNLPAAEEAVQHRLNLIDMMLKPKERKGRFFKLDLSPEKAMKKIVKGSKESDKLFLVGKKIHNESK